MTRIGSVWNTVQPRSELAQSSSNHRHLHKLRSHKTCRVSNTSAGGGHRVLNTCQSDQCLCVDTCLCLSGKHSTLVAIFYMLWISRQIKWSFAYRYQDVCSACFFCKKTSKKVADDSFAFTFEIVRYVWGYWTNPMNMFSIKLPFNIT